MTGRHFICAALASVALGGAAKAAVIPFTYNYHDTTFYQGNEDFVAESNDNETRLNNGTLGTNQPGGGNPNVIYQNGLFELYSQGQASATITFPSVTALTSLDVSYGVYQAPGVYAPLSVTISDGVNTPIVFTGFDTSINLNGGGDARLVTIPLTGLSGTTLEVSFAITGDFVGLSQLTFNGTSVPEPASLGVLGVGAFAFATRRTRRSIVR